MIMSRFRGPMPSKVSEDPAIDVRRARSSPTRVLKNFIGGELRDSRVARSPRSEDPNPADAAEVVADAPMTTAAEAADACAAAARAFEGWRNTPAPVRGQILFKVHRRLEERRAELAEALTREEGKTLS